MKKLLILLMMLPLWMSGQVIPTTKNPDGSIILSGKGSLGGLNDNVQLRRYKYPTQGNFEVSGYFRSISNKNSAVGFLFRNEGAANNKSLATAGVILQRDSLKCVIRYRNNTTMDLVASTPGISLPCHLKEEKNGNSLKYYYSKQPENATVITWILVLKVENVFTDWVGLNHNVLNPAGLTTATAVLASLNFKTVALDQTDTRPSCNNGGNFTIASVTNTSGSIYNIDFNAANLSNTQVVIRNSSNTIVRDFTQPITARPQSIDFGSLINGQTYTVQFTGVSCQGVSNAKSFVGVGNVNNGGGGGNTTVSGYVFPNMFSSITPETQNDIFGAEKFMNLTYPTGLVRGSFPKTFNGDLGLTIPNWINILHTNLSIVYKNKGYNVIDDFGYLGSVDIRTHGTQGTDWQLFPWGNFVTALPIERRVETYLGTLVYDFLNLNDAGVIQKGFDIANNTDFGNIVVNGKSQRMYTSVDSEGAGEDGSAGIHKPLLLFKTIFENTRGIVSYMYGQPIRSDLGYTTNGFGYPDANGNLPLSDINPLFRDSESFNGVPYKLIDSKGLAPHGEISHYGETAYGNYNDGVRQLTVFGPNANNEHYLARVVEHNEKNYYAYKKLGGADLLMFQNKMICDRGTNGWKYNDGTRQNGGTKAAFTGYLKRDQIFKSQMASFFCGVHTVDWNRPPTGLNSDAQNGIEEARTILNTEVIFSPTERISALKLRTGTFEFSLWNAEYKLQGETNWRKEKGYQLKERQDNLLVRFMRKGNYIVVFVCDPYNLATKKNLTVRWGTFEKSYTIADWASCYADGSTKDYIYAIYNIGQITTDGGSASAPIIQSNPTNPVTGISVTFSTSSQCSGTIKWYNADAQVATGVSCTVANPVANDTYTATCTVGTSVSLASNVISIAANTSPPGVTITEPALAYNNDGSPTYYFSDGKAPSYYSNRNNLPAIIAHSSPAYYNEATECVVMSNANVKYVFNLRRGLHLNGAYRVGSNFNYVYNGYDGGFQVGIDMHQKPDRNYSQGGKNSSDCQDDAGYNVTHGGTYTNGNGISYTPTLIDYHKIGTNKYYGKFRPLFYTLNPGEFAKNEMEVTCELIGDVLKIDYVYTSFRDDNQINTSFGFVGQSVPACFLNNQLTRFKSYTGNSAWTNGTLTDVLIPTSGGCATPGESRSPEHWGFAYNPNTGLGFGVMNLTHLSDDAGIVYKQCEVSSGNPPGTEFGGGFTYIAPTLSMQNFSSGTSTFTTTAYIMVGTDTQVRTQFKTVSGN